MIVIMINIVIDFIVGVMAISSDYCLIYASNFTFFFNIALANLTIIT